jgi:hypothetical protein
MPAGRVPGLRKEPTRKQIENVSGEKPANSARSRLWEQAGARHVLKLPDAIAVAARVL